MTFCIGRREFMTLLWWPGYCPATCCPCGWIAPAHRRPLDQFCAGRKNAHRSLCRAAGWQRDRHRVVRRGRGHPNFSNWRSTLFPVRAGLGFLANPAGASMKLWVQQVEAAARARGIAVLIQEAGTPDDIAPAFDGFPSQAVKIAALHASSGFTRGIPG
jgi:hypothetical protein